MIKAGIIGATGYAGQELVRLLLQHKEVEIVWYGSRSYVDKKFSSVFGNVFQIVENICKSDDLHTLAKEADVKEMWLTHYSPSLNRPEEHMEQVREIFPRAKAAKDGWTAELGFEEE